MTEAKYNVVEFQCAFCFRTSDICTDNLGDGRFASKQVPITVAKDFLGKDFTCNACGGKNAIGSTHPVMLTLTPYQKEKKNDKDTDKEHSKSSEISNGGPEDY